MGIVNIAPLDEASLRALIDKPETDGLEFKSKILSHSAIADYVVGIGNSGGGFLIMGVTNKPPRRICGLEEFGAEALQKLRRSVYDSTSIRVELETVGTKEGFVLGVRVPPCPPGTVFHTRDGKYLIRVGEDLVGLSTDEVRARLNESQPPTEAIEDLPITVRFMMQQHPQNYSLYVSNESELAIQPVEVCLEKEGLKLANPARKEWPAIPPRSAATLHWQPSRNPEEFLTIKWRERMAVNRPHAYTYMDEIEVTVVYTLPGGRRGKHRERIMMNVDFANHTMQQWG